MLTFEIRRQAQVMVRELALHCRFSPDGIRSKGHQTRQARSSEEATSNGEETRRTVRLALF